MYHATAHKTELVAACLQLLNGNPKLSIDSVAHHLAQGVQMLTTEVDMEAEEDLGLSAHPHTEVKQFGQDDLHDHAAFVVQQMTPILGRHALKVHNSELEPAKFLLGNCSCFHVQNDSNVWLPYCKMLLVDCK